MFGSQTPPEVMNSMLGMTLKRHLLLRLAEKEKVYPDDPEKMAKIYKRYSQFVIPVSLSKYIH